MIILLRSHYEISLRLHWRRPTIATDVSFFLFRFHFILFFLLWRRRYDMRWQYFYAFFTWGMRTHDEWEGVRRRSLVVAVPIHCLLTLMQMNLYESKTDTHTWAPYTMPPMNLRADDSGKNKTDTCNSVPGAYMHSWFPTYSFAPFNFCIRLLASSDISSVAYAWNVSTSCTVSYFLIACTEWPAVLRLCRPLLSHLIMIDANYLNRHKYSVQLQLMKTNRLWIMQMFIIISSCIEYRLFLVCFFSRTWCRWSHCVVVSHSTEAGWKEKSTYWWLFVVYQSHCGDWCCAAVQRLPV